MKLRLRSLRVRAPLVVALVVIAMPAFAWLSHLSDATVGWRMLQRVERTAQAVAEGRDPDEQARQHSLWVRVLSAEGTLQADADHDPPTGLSRWSSELFFGPDGAPSLADWDAQQPPLAKRAFTVGARQQGQASGCASAAEGALLVCTAALATDDGRVIYVTESSRRAIRALYDVRYQLVKLTLQVLAMGIVLGAWLGWRMVRPVEQLRRQVLDRTARRSTDSIVLHRDDELGDLADAFNALLAALEQRRRANEDFAADLVHELKNPVAAVKVAAEALERGTPSPQRAQRLAAVLTDASGRLDALVSEFLELARAEAGLRGRPREDLALDELLAALVQAARDRHDDVGFSLDATPGCRVHGVPERIEGALRNLLDNAAAFAREGVGPATVSVRCAVVGAAVQVDVCDSGPGIAADDMERVFERYFTRRHGGTGLGLPLARAIARAHGGELVALPDSMGAHLRLTLPGG